jgi:hypothetical protein
MFKVQVEQDFSFLSGEYRALFADSQATAFQAPVWLEHLYSSRLLSDCPNGSSSRSGIRASAF